MCYDNLFWGMQFRTCRKFWESTDFSLVLSQNFLQIQKPHRHYFDCDSLRESATNLAQNCNSPSLRGVANAEAIQNKNQSARSVNHCPTRHTEATKSPKYPLKSFCFVWLSPKVESQLPLNHNLPIVQGKKIVGDSQVAKMDSSRCRAQNDESSIDCFGDELPRNHNA